MQILSPLARLCAFYFMIGFVRGAPQVTGDLPTKAMPEPNPEFSFKQNIARAIDIVKAHYPNYNPIIIVATPPAFHPPSGSWSEFMKIRVTLTAPDQSQAIKIESIPDLWGQWGNPEMIAYSLPPECISWDWSTVLLDLAEVMEILVQASYSGPWKEVALLKERPDEFHSNLQTYYLLVWGQQRRNALVGASDGHIRIVQSEPLDMALAIGLEDGAASSVSNSFTDTS